MDIGNIATTGMQAAMSNMETISNNIANAQTLGFKKSSATFSDIVPSGSNASGSQIGLGVQLSGVQQNFQPGGAIQTTAPSDFSISGNGFFILHNQTSGQAVYSRSGHLTFDKQTGTFMSGTQRLQGFLAVNGLIPSGSAPADLVVNTATQPAKASATVTAQGLNLNSGSTAPTTTPFSATDNTSYNFTTHSTLYDSLGNSNSLDLYYVKTGTNAWSVYTAVNGSVQNAATPGTATFSDTGQLLSTTGLSGFSYTPSTGAAALNFSVSLAGSTQTGSGNSISSVTADGYPAGQFIGYAVDNNGMLSANYSSGPAVLVGQIAVANFQSPQNLQNLGGATWAATTAAGSPSVTPSNSLSNIQQGFLESSNVDLSAELVNLISAQNTFQANAQVEQVFTQVMQTVTKL